MEQENLEKISSLSACLLELKSKLSQLENEKDILLQEKCYRMKKLKQHEYNGKTSDMDERERELCRSTNRLVEEFVNSCDQTPFNKALVHVLGNMKGIFLISF